MSQKRSRHSSWRHRVARAVIVACGLSLGTILLARTGQAQDLTPRAYLVTPSGSNAILVTDVYNDGDLNLEGTVPIEDATGRINGVAIGFYRSLGFFGRAANVTVILPYGTGTFDGIVLGSPYTAHRSGLFDIPVRLALNLIGGDCLYGRYWGSVEPHAFLHFEVCYYQAIEYAIEHKLARVEAGAQGEHKLARGYMPVTTYSAHWIADPGLRRAVARYLLEERAAVAATSAALAGIAPYRKDEAG